MGSILKRLCSRQVPHVASHPGSLYPGFSDPWLGFPGLAGWFQICPGNQLAGVGGTGRARGSPPTFKLLSKNPSRQSLTREQKSVSIPPLFLFSRRASSNGRVNKIGNINSEFADKFCEITAFFTLTSRVKLPAGRGGLGEAHLDNSGLCTGEMQLETSVVFGTPLAGPASSSSFCLHNAANCEECRASSFACLGRQRQPQRLTNRGH